MQAERDLQVVTLKRSGMLRQQVFEHTQLEREEAGAEHLRVQLEQPRQHRMDLATCLRTRLGR